MRTIPLNQTQGGGRVALVDDEDYARVTGFKWSVDGAYAQAIVNGRKVRMHRFILGFPPNRIDHHNRDGLDNRRDNLRLCATQSQNGANSAARGGTSAFKGVHWDRARSKWLAQIMVDRRQIFLGRFTSEAEAALAYDVAARRAWGPFAQLNLETTKCPP